MFEKERAEIMVLSNIASDQGMLYVSDLLRTAEREWARAEEYRAKLQPQVDRVVRLKLSDVVDRETGDVRIGVEVLSKRLPDLGDE